MKFKTLKHKTLDDTFGFIDDDMSDGKYFDIYPSSVPTMYPMTCTWEDTISYWLDKSEAVIMQLEDYELVTVELTVL